MQINAATVTLFSCPGLQTNPVTTQGLVVTWAVPSCSSRSPSVTFGYRVGNGKVVWGHICWRCLRSAQKPLWNVLFSKHWAGCS